jgi:hypothetical protein
MEQANLVCNPLLRVVEDFVVAVDVLGGVVSNVVALGSWIRLCNLGRVGHILVGCPSFSHSARRLSSGRKWSCGLNFLSFAPSGGSVAASWGRGWCGRSMYWDLHR